MKVWPFEFQAGDVIETGFGLCRLVEQLEDDEQGRDMWRVHYIALDIEMEHGFVDQSYQLVEVMA